MAPTTRSRTAAARAGAKAQARAKAVAPWTAKEAAAAAAGLGDEKAAEEAVSVSSSLRNLKDPPKAGFVAYDPATGPRLVAEEEGRLPTAPPLNIRVWQERAPRGGAAKKVPNCGLVDGSVTISTYGTLRVHGVTHVANTVLTSRGVQDLPGQMRFDETYVEHMRKRGLQRGRHVNAAFGEWLFGFPTDYTLTTEERPAKRRRLQNGGRLPAASVFSGCDGLAKGVEEWVDVQCYCEANPAPRQLLESKMQRGLLRKSAVVEDIRHMDGRELRKLGVQMLIGGFPCQDISISGSMKGFRGKRSSLFFEMMRVAEEGKVNWLFLENVAAIACKKMQSVLARVLQTLHDKGYSSRYICLCANEVGCPMYRRRWFLLAKHHRADPSELRKLVSPPPTMEEWQKEVKKPWNPEYKPKMEDWLLHSASEENSNRLKMLGNAVVPQMSRRALQLLVHGRPAAAAAAGGK